MGKYLLGQGVAEHFVVDPVILDDDAALGDAGGAAGLEDVDRLVRSALGTQRRTGPPRSHSSSKRPNFFRSSKALTSLRGSKLEAFRLLDPEGRAGLGVEVPFDGLAHVGVEPLAGLADFVG